MSSRFQNDAIFWVEVDKIKPNPYQPRRDFNEERLRDLAESIRQYGVLQPLTVTRKEQVKEDGGLKVEYELIAGERRHRASQLANLSQVPVIIRSGEEDAQVKLELAIIENLQREDLNPIERAEAFDRLANEFEFTHKEIAEKIGKSREYVSNSMRLLKLPEKIKQAIINGQMTEGHARPIMMLRDKPEQQEMLFKEVIHKGLTVREAESIARRDAQDKVRKKKNKINPETKKLEDQLSDTLGTRVKIEEREKGGKLVIDFFTQEDLQNIIKLMQGDTDVEMSDMMEEYIQSVSEADDEEDESTDADASEQGADENIAETLGSMIAAARERQQKQQETEEATAAADNTAPAATETEATTTDASGVDMKTSQPVQQKEAQHSVAADLNEVETNATDSATTAEELSDTNNTQGEVVSGEQAGSAEKNDTADTQPSSTEEEQESESAESSSTEDGRAPASAQGSGEAEEEEEEIYSVSNFSI